MQPLKSFQKKYLRGLAHGLRPVVQIGQKGLNPGLVAEVDVALEHHELIKIKFNDIKGKSEKEQLSMELCRQTRCENIAMLGHVCILYRRQSDADKRKIRVPVREI